MMAFNYRAVIHEIKREVMAVSILGRTWMRLEVVCLMALGNKCLFISLIRVDVTALTTSRRPQGRHVRIKAASLNYT